MKFIKYLLMFLSVIIPAIIAGSVFMVFFLSTATESTVKECGLLWVFIPLSIVGGGLVTLGISVSLIEKIESYFIYYEYSIPNPEVEIRFGSNLDYYSQGTNIKSNLKSKKLKKKKRLSTF